MANSSTVRGHIWPDDILAKRFTIIPNDLPAALASRGLNTTDICIVIALFQHAWDSAIVWPSYDTIANEAGVSRATVTRRLPVVEKAGVIIITKHGDSTSPNQYDLSPAVEVVRQYRAGAGTNRTKPKNCRQGRKPRNTVVQKPTTARAPEAERVSAAMPPSPAPSHPPRAQATATDTSSDGIPARRARWGVPRYDPPDRHDGDDRAPGAVEEESSAEPQVTMQSPGTDNHQMADLMAELKARLAPLQEMNRRSQEARQAELERVQNDPEYAARYWHRIHQQSSRCHGPLRHSPAVEAMLQQFLPESA